jgi:hypothetical protein
MARLTFHANKGRSKSLPQVRGLESFAATNTFQQKMNAIIQAGAVSAERR